MSEQTHNPAQEPQNPPQEPPEAQEPPDGTPEPQEEPETFPRKVVEDLRRENAEHRTKAKRADDLAAALVTALAAGTGRLADPSDLPFSAALLDEAGIPDVERIDAAVTALLGAKPHLASRKPRGDVGQGATTEASSVDLAGILRARAS